jgi:uncharacterized protein with FMN-binding domain
MKRAMLIVSGTISGLGAVLAITPPQLSATSSGVSGLPGANSTTEIPSQSASPSATATQSATPKATKKATATNKSTPKATATDSAAPAPTQASAAVSGTFTGSAVNVSYGIVQVQITVENGKITDAQAIQAPSGRNQRWTDMAIPTLRKNTLAAQSNNINGASGASYTSYGWYTSLTSALKKAGMI